MRATITADLLAAAAIVIVSAYGFPWLLRRYQLHFIRREVCKHRYLALTYDDGPSAELTPKLLDLLNRRGARVTFFMLGQHAQQYPELVDRVLREGHHVGCHSDRHVNALKAPPWKAHADIQAGYARLSRWIAPNAMFRPPHGKMTIFTYWLIRLKRAPIVWWTVDSGDTHKEIPGVGDVAERVRRDGGGIVLMHDLNRTRARNEFVIDATSALLDLAERDGLQIIPVEELYQ